MLRNRAAVRTILALRCFHLVMHLAVLRCCGGAALDGECLPPSGPFWLFVQGQHLRPADMLPLFVACSTKCTPFLEFAICDLMVTVRMVCLQVRVTGAGALVAVWFAAHGMDNGAWVPPAEVERDTTSGRIRVYVAFGSHASFPKVRVARDAVVQHPLRAAVTAFPQQDATVSNAQPAGERTSDTCARSTMLQRRLLAHSAPTASL